MILRNGNARSKSKCTGSCLVLPSFRTKGFHEFGFLPAIYDGAGFPTTSTTECIAVLFYFYQFVCNVVLICMSLIIRMFEHFFWRAYIFIRNCLFYYFPILKLTFKRPIFTTREGIEIKLIILNCFFFNVEKHVEVGIQNKVTVIGKTV